MSQRMVRWLAVVSVVLSTAQGGGGRVRIGEGSVVPENPRSRWCRYVNWRPADREVVELNPPRISWPDRADFPEAWGNAQHSFTLQVSDRADMADPVVSVETWFNFYNTLPTLSGDRKWYWRVGYDVGSADETWSETRGFLATTTGRKRACGRAG